MKILLVGGSGYIGKNITNILVAKGYEVAWLTRKINTACNVKQHLWNYESGHIDAASINNCDVIINLTGANISKKRWTKKYKAEIYNSRIQSTRFLIDELNKINHSVKTFIQISAVGYYGINKTDEVINEAGEPGSDFLAKTCADWEAAANELNQHSTRLIIIRTGVVFNAGSEAYKKMLQPIKYGLGTNLGTGKQYFNWVHIDDLCSTMLFSINNPQIKGIYNCVAPVNLTQEEVTNTLCQTLHKPHWLPNVPVLIARLLLGEVADILLNGNKISASKIEEAGFVFKHRVIK